MKIVVTTAGQSKRFSDAGYSLPKFMLPVLNTTMLHQVISMFDTEDSFLIVTSDTLYDRYSEFFESLKNSYRKLEVISINQHTFGPVQTLLSDKVRQWVGPDDFVVSYCDFFLNWDYNSFLKHIQEWPSHGCIVSFTGMQPASRGSTMFAYLRTSEEQVLEVREKSCFTDNRLQEFASAGIYYFKSYAIFQQGVQHSSRHFAQFSEKYASLVFNGILDLGLTVTHFPVKQFVCLGTPQDYEEFVFWDDYFESVHEEVGSVACVKNKLIPMAGFGQRFKNAGILVPKPFIPIRNKAMFVHAVEAFPRAEKSIVVALEDQIDRVKRATGSTSLAIQTVALRNRTSGPGHTVLESLDAIPSGEDVLVMSCDYDLRCEKEPFEDAMNDEKTKVILFYTKFSEFRMKEPKAFAYCETNNEGIVHKIVEKELLGENPSADKLLVGSFWFRSPDYLRIALNNSIIHERYINGELFIANSLNELLELDIRIRAVPVKHWISFGDPEEFEIYGWWENLFKYLS